jgi:peptidoglycan/LPS O-acetylase OafA/YrhL
LTDLPITDLRNPAPAPRQPRPPQLKALTSIRFFAALHVALFHLVRPFALWGPFAGFMGAGYTGVSFFFLLSGFILTYSHAHEPATGPAFRRRFYFARFARIYPVYFLITLAAGYVLRSQFAQHVHILAFAAQLLVVQTWSVRMVSFFNVPAWSVSVEVFFYAVFPFLFLRLRPSSRLRGMIAIGIFWLLAIALPLLAVWKFPAGAWHEENGNFVFFIRRFPPAALPEFLAGISLGWLYLRFPPSRIQGLLFTLAGAAGLLVTLVFADHLPFVVLHNGLLIPFQALLLVGLTQPNLISRLLANPVLLLLGEASYSLYLVHYILNLWLDDRFHLDDGFHSLAIKLSLAIATSIALHLLVERPSRKALLRRWNRDHRPAHA